MHRYQAMELFIDAIEETLAHDGVLTREKWTELERNLLPCSEAVFVEVMTHIEIRTKINPILIKAALEEQEQLTAAELKALVNIG